LLPEQHQAQIARTKATAEAAKRRVEAARHSVAGRQRTQQIRNIGRDRPDPVTGEEVAEAQIKIYELEALWRAEMEQLNDLEHQDPSAKILRAKAELAAAEARLDQARQTLDDCTLRAPDLGVVLRVLVSPGDLVHNGQQSAIEFCPDLPRIIRAEVDQEFAERLQVGQAAGIEDDVNPARTWTGTVQRLSSWYTQRRSANDDPTKLKDVRTLECIVALEPDQPPVKIGQRVRVLIRPLPTENQRTATAGPPRHPKIPSLRYHQKTPIIRASLSGEGQ
jgi:HlyD family secretion protein